MLSPLRKRAGRRLREPFGKAGLTVAVIALVFAMLGGAYAASKLTSKQKKEVEKIAKKFQGTGPAGAQGAAGANGKDGANGTNGKDGVNGIDGTNGTNGTDGTDGTDGKSVHVGTVLPGPTEGCGEAGGIEVEVEGSGEPPEYVCNGKSGSGGGGFKYAFSTNVEETDPTAGNLKLNNATPSSATRLLVSETDGEAIEIAAAIHKWTTGVSTQGLLTISREGSPGTFAEYTVRGGIACLTAGQKLKPNQCGMTDEGAYDAISVAYVTGSGTLAANDPVTISYTSVGSPTLPPGAIETGAWSFSREVDTFTADVNGTPEEIKVGNSKRILVPLTLTTPLAASINTSEPPKVHWQEDADFTTFCEGTVSEPIPKNSGEVCIYAALLPLENTKFEQVFRASSFESENGEERSFSRAGGVMAFKKPTSNAEGDGTFAVKG